MNIKAAIFDMDGTLVDSLGCWDVLWSALGKRFLGDAAFRPSEQDDKRVRTMILPDAMELVHRNYSLGESGEMLLAIANEIVIDFYSHSVKPKPGVVAFLEHCKSHGVKMCIASATALHLVELALAHCNLGSYFSGVLSCGTLGKGKDHPDIFLHAANFLGEEPSQTWVFEDSLVAIETATKIGMPTVGIYDRYNFGQETIKKIATAYIDCGETLLKLIE